MLSLLQNGTVILTVDSAGLGLMWPTDHCLLTLPQEAKEGNVREAVDVDSWGQGWGGVHDH